MRTFYTALDIERLAERGDRKIVIELADVVTDEAMDLARRMGIEIVRRSAHSEEPPASDQTHERKPSARQTSTSATDLEEIRRSEFGSLQKIHLANCSQGAQPARAAKALAAFVANWRDEGMDWDYWMAVVNDAKASFARLINAAPEDIAISFSVSSLVGTVASALDYRGMRNKVVTTELDFPTVPNIWFAHERLGAEVDLIPVSTRGDIDLAEYRRHIDQKTLLTSIPLVYYRNGFKQDVAEIAGIAHQAGSLVLVDAYQGLGTTPVDVQAMDLDFLVSGCLKYLLGVPGIAFAYTKPEVRESLQPTSTGWFGQADPFAFSYRLNYATDGRRLETGTPPATAAFPAKASIDLLLEIGVERISRRCDELSQYCIEGAKQRGLPLVSDFDIAHKAPTTAIVVPDAHAMEVALKRQGIVASARGDVIRLAHHFFVREEEIDQALDAITSILKGGAPRGEWRREEQ